MNFKDLVPLIKEGQVGEAKFLLNVFDARQQGQVIKRLQMSNKDKLWKGFVKLFHSEFAEYVLPQEVRDRLDLALPRFLDTELNELLSLDGAAGDQMQADLIVAYPRKDNPSFIEKVHYEFQEFADFQFTKRTAKYMRLINSNFNIRSTTFAIIHKVHESFKDNLLIGSAKNGILFKFQYYGISEREEQEFLSRPKSIVSQVFYSNWLVLQTKMSLKNKLEKFTAILNNISQIVLDDERLVTAVLFVLKNLYICCKSDKNFINFVSKNEFLTRKFRVMTIIEEIEFNSEVKGELRGIQIGEQRGIQIGEQRGEQRGIQIGEQRAKEEAVKKEEAAIKRMLDNKIAVEMIAKCFQTTVEHVDEVQQRLKMR